jgi:hypothetical protein
MSLIRFLQPRIGSLLETAATSRSKILIPDFHDLSDPDQFKTYIPEQGSSKQRIETIRSEWQAACEEWTSLNVSEVLDEELIVGYAEGAVRQLVLETAVGPPEQNLQRRNLNGFRSYSTKSLYTTPMDRLNTAFIVKCTMLWK